MNRDRSLCMLIQPEQWARCAHDGTALLPGGGVELSWKDDAAECGRGASTHPAGLAFDRWCRSYRSRPTTGTIEVSGSSEPHCPGGLRYPLGLAIDRRQRLYVAETGAAAVHVVDLWAQRLLRKVPFGCRRPVDVATDCGGAVVLVLRAPGLLRLDGRRGPRPGPTLVTPRCHGELEPCRVATGPLVLWRRPGGTHAVVATPEGTVLVEVPGATDLDVTAEGILVVARAPGQSFRRFSQDGSGWVELEPVGAPDYDGGAICVAPSGRITFTTSDGVGWTSGSAATHITKGTVVTYRLDSLAYRTRWGRLFLDACLPPSTSVALQVLTSDNDEVPDPIPATPPDRGTAIVQHPEATPPLPSKTLLDAAAAPQPLFRRPTGREQPWAQIAANDGFETYEAPIGADPGRYLWIKLILRGTERVTPRVRAMRVERPGHQLLRSLPRSWSRDDGDADFLHRFLSPTEGMLHELDDQAAQRAVLIDPQATPQEALSWLASFAGLVLDRRWPEDARRSLIAEAYPLYRRRGTKPALTRILEVYLGRPPVIIEQWQLRGLGGTVLGTAPQGPPPPTIGASTRTTGTLGRFTIGGSTLGSDSYRLSAHRFSVLVPTELTPEQRAVVADIVEHHRPAHTLGEVCELGLGMRVGQRLRLGLTSFVGPGADWGPAIVGQVLVGEDGVVGLPAVGSRVGTTSRTGQVRVG
ncbi:MAG: phage tail protein [Candidatus Dormibacteria bacterium]